MNKDCSKYESLFVFSSSKDLEEHIKDCPTCRLEHEKMQKVSELIGEVKFHYKLQARKMRKLRAICAVALLMLFTASFPVIENSGDLADALLYGNTLSAEDLGFPVDSYGLLMVDDEF
jgi:hypothetical protein